MKPAEHQAEIEKALKAGDVKKVKNEPVTTVNRVQTDDDEE